MRLIAATLLLCGFVFGQSQSGNQSQNTQPQNSNQNAQLAMRPGTQDASEQRITKEVRHELVMLPYYSIFDDLEYQVSGNTVTLLGAVVNPTLKSDAENAVKHV